MAKEFIIIKKSTTETAWYAKKIGYMFQVDEDVSFPNCYTIRISHKKNKANYGTVSLEDAEILTPTILEKIKIALKY